MSDQPKTYGSAQGDIDLYAVEVRSTSGISRSIGDFILTSEWKRLPFHETVKTIGIPICTYHPIRFEHIGLVNYEAAMACAMHFLAMPDKTTVGFMPVLDAEARIVKVKLTFSYSTEEVGVGERILLFEMRRNAKFSERSK